LVGRLSTSPLGETDPVGDWVRREEHLHEQKTSKFREIQGDVV
jgi:hypothetical protein